MAACAAGVQVQGMLPSLFGLAKKPLGALKLTVYQKMSMLKDIELAVRVLKKGGVIAYPTDTAYGLGALANSVPALKKIYKIKGRSAIKAVSIAVSDLSQARKIAVFDERALIFWRKFMPGTLTLVLPLKKSLFQRKSWRILSGGKKVGIRMAKHPFPQLITKKLGVPITTTSANISGKSPCYSAQEIELEFKKRKYKPDLIVNGGKLKKGRISTVVDLTANDIKILREGSISKKQIFDALKQMTI